MEILTQWCIVYSRLHMLQGPILNVCVNRSISGETGAEPKGIAIFLSLFTVVPNCISSHQDLPLEFHSYLHHYKSATGGKAQPSVSLG